MPHPCLRHIKGCSAVIAAGSGRAEQIRREVERADGLLIQEAVITQGLECETFAQMLTRSRLPVVGTRDLVRGGAYVPSPRALLRGVEEVPTYYEEEVNDAIAP